MKLESFLNELPKSSPWPLRLLGIEMWETRVKSPAELIREFENEKWGPLWERVRSMSGQTTLSDVEDLLFNKDSELICLQDGTLVKMQMKDAFQAQYLIQKHTIAGLMPGKALLELGAGYGQIILRLAKEEQFARLPVMAAEYTESGTDLLNFLARSQNSEITVGRCDFSSYPVTDLAVPPDSIVFTSFATHYVPEYGHDFIDKILELHPQVVVHFEPVYEHCDISTLLGAMQRRYIEVNDYNRNMLTILKQAEESGLIDIIIEQSQCFGSNPFLPLSVVAWKRHE